MAREIQIAAYRKFVRDIELRILRSTEAFLRRAAAKIISEIVVLNGSFFSKMVSMGIDKAGPPSLAEFTPSWKPLSPSYLTRKQSRAPGKGFYYFSGALQRSLMQARGSLLGVPTADLVKVPKSLKQPSPTFRLVIEPAPRLRNLRGRALLEAINGPTAQRALKLSNFRGQMTRPLLQPYLNWHVKYVVTPSVLRRLK